MSGDLAGQAMVVRSTWNRARAYRAFAAQASRAKKIMKESIKISKCPVKLTEKITLAGIKV